MTRTIQFSRTEGACLFSSLLRSIGRRTLVARPALVNFFFPSVSLFLPRQALLSERATSVGCRPRAALTWTPESPQGEEQPSCSTRIRQGRFPLFSRPTSFRQSRRSSGSRGESPGASSGLRCSRVPPVSSIEAAISRETRTRTYPQVAHIKTWNSRWITGSGGTPLRCQGGGT